MVAGAAGAEDLENAPGGQAEEAEAAATVEAAGAEDLEDIPGGQAKEAEAAASVTAGAAAGAAGGAAGSRIRHRPFVGFAVNKEAIKQHKTQKQLKAPTKKPKEHQKKPEGPGNPREAGVTSKVTKGNIVIRTT